MNATAHTSIVSRNTHTAQEAEVTRKVRVATTAKVLHIDETPAHIATRRKAKEMSAANLTIARARTDAQRAESYLRELEREMGSESPTIQLARARLEMARERVRLATAEAHLVSIS